MDNSGAAWVVIVVALLGANLPFASEQLFACIPLKIKSTAVAKPVWLRLLELALGYVAVGLVAHVLEQRIGNVFAQGWEFYAVTVCLFLVLAFPGFVFRYLRKSAAASQPDAAA